METDKIGMIKSALILLVAGMGTTFLFLVIQALVTNALAWFTKPFAALLAEPAPKKAPASPAKKPAAQEDEGAVVAAIAAVLHHASK